MKAYVINLDRNPERLRAFQAQFEALGIPFERHAAVDGKRVSDEELAEFQSTRPQNGKPWIRGKMGCFLSHHGVWTKIATSDERYSAIFEDDVHVSRSLKSFVESDKWIPEGTDIVRFEPSTNRILLSKEPVTRRLGRRRLFKVRSTSWCAGGYVISRSAAKRLIDLPEEYHCSPDHILFSYEDSIVAPTLNALQIVPALCIQDKLYHRNAADIVFPSEIINNEKGQSFGVRLKYALRRSPLRYLRKSVQGYKRIHFAP
jgi:glycosyl transferase, family 25